jgi:hemerythrin-like domain-containing protein
MVGYLRHFVERCHFAKEERYLFATAEELGLGGSDLDDAIALHADVRNQVRTLHDLSTELHPWQAVDHRRLVAAATALRTAIDRTLRLEEDVLFPRLVAGLTAPQRREIALRMAAFAMRELGSGELDRHLAMGESIAACADAMGYEGAPATSHEAPRARSSG